MRTLNIIFWIGYLYTLYLFTPLKSICTENAACVQEMLRDFTGAYLAVTMLYFIAWLPIIMCFLNDKDDKKERK